uniref:NADH-ubiquinone oxidoreductase chain 6 n=1 Tax=Laparocerus freyi TaxID=1763381 RepID=A0A3G2JZC2_9CUCU|nr:NADH dehydrogenase subunit 6 [Laparocerus freyi]
MLLMIMMNWTLSLIFIFLNHPLSMGFILLSQTILISIITGMMNLNFWFSYILFLIMIGGMLVLFIYMTSIASNEKFKFSNKITFIISLTLIMMTMIFLMDNFFTLTEMNNLDSMNLNSLNINLSMNKYLNKPSMLTMILLMNYLLLTLIAIVKITQSKMGPLRPYK